MNPTTQIVYDYLATQRGTFYTCRALGLHLNMSTSSARLAVTALWAVQLIEARGGRAMTYGIEEAHGTVRRTPEAR